MIFDDKQILHADDACFLLPCDVVVCGGDSFYYLHVVEGLVIHNGRFARHAQIFYGQSNERFFLQLLHARTL